MKNMRQFGPLSKAYGVGTVEDRLRYVMSGKQAENSLADKIRGDITDYSRTMKKKKHRSNYYMNKDLSSISSSFFFPQKGTLSAEQTDKVLFAVRSIVDPFPTPKLPEDKSGKGKNMGYQAQRKIKYSRLAMPAAVMSDIVSSYTPVMELGEWAKRMYKKMGGSGEAPQVVNGKISPMAYINIMVNSRFANENWFSGKNGIHGKTPTGVLREMAVMDSVKIEMQRRQMKYMQQISALLAQDQAMKTGERFNDSLNKMYEKVVQ